jgi:hypothetical protein
MVTLRMIISLRNWNNKAFNYTLTPQAVYGVRPESEEGGI